MDGPRLSCKQLEPSAGRGHAGGGQNQGGEKAEDGGEPAAQLPRQWTGSLRCWTFMLSATIYEAMSVTAKPTQRSIDTHASWTAEPAATVGTVPLGSYCHGGLVPAGAEVQEHPATLPLDLIDLLLAVVLAAGLEGEQFRIPRERLEGCQQISYGHAPSVAATAR